MVSAIFSQALREYLRFRRLVPWLLLSLLCLLVAANWKQISPNTTMEGSYSTVSLGLVFRIMALASAIFTTAIITQEVEQRTIVYLVTRPVPRWKLLLVRYVASVLVVAGLGVIAALLTSLGSFHSLSANGLLAQDIKALLIGAVAYGAFFLFISLLFNRALIICALYAFGWEASIPNMPGSMSRLSIFSNLQALAQHPTETDSKAISVITGTAGDGMITSGQAIGTLVILVVGLLALSAWWFTHFEYVPREDAE